MGVEMKNIYPFSVDTWSVSSKRKPVHFLTHAHRDHTTGIDCHGSSPIYCSLITQKIVLRRHRKLSKSMFRILEIAEPKLIADDEDSFTVTAFDANHCPGAIMLLFEGGFGKVLHTGDCRLTIDCLNKLPPQYIGRRAGLDCLYLDCTFGKEAMVMPTREDAIQQVIRCIWNHPKDAPVYLACDILGQESLLNAVVETFGMKIYVDKDKLPEYHADLSLVAPEIMASNKQSTRFHICEGFPKLYDRAERAIRDAKLMRFPEPLFIRPSAQYYTYEERLQGAGSGLLSASSALSRIVSQRYCRATTAPREAEKDPSGIWHVCFSMHSSRGELEKALKILNPDDVISTTPHCGAVELFAKQINSQVEALEVCVETNPVVPNLVCCSPEKCVLEEDEAKRGKRDYSCTPVKRTKTQDWTHDSSPQRVVPLFGHARFGVPPSPPLSFPSPCKITSNVCIEKEIVLSHSPCPPSSLSPILTVEVQTENNPSETSSVLQASNPLKASSPFELSSPLKAICERGSTSPKNIRSKRLFGSVENIVGLEVEKVENTITVEVEKAQSTVTVGVEKVEPTTFRRSSFRILRLDPLPSLLDFL